MTSRSWDNLKGEIFLGSEAFIGKHAAPNKGLKEIPEVQLRASGDRAIVEAYDRAYRLHEIAAYFGVHYGTVSRRLKQIEQTN